MVCKVNTEYAVSRKTLLQALQPFGITLKSASWHTGAAGKKVINHQIKEGSTVTRHKRLCILAIDLSSTLIDPKVIRGHFNVNGILLDCREGRIGEERLQLQYGRARTKAQDQNASGVWARMKIKPQPKQVPDAPGDHPTRIELAVQDAIGIKPQARARPADFVAFALTLLSPENGYDKAPGLMWVFRRSRSRKYRQISTSSAKSNGTSSP